MVRLALLLVATTAAALTLEELLTLGNVDAGSQEARILSLFFDPTENAVYNDARCTANYLDALGHSEWQDDAEKARRREFVLVTNFFLSPDVDDFTRASEH